MRGAAKLFLVVLALGVLFWPGIQHHWKLAQDPYFVPFDASHVIPPFFKFHRNDPTPTNYIKEYYLNALSPPLYKASIWVGGQFADVRHFQLAMLYLTYAVFIGILGRLGWLLGGATLSFAVMALTITAWCFIGLGFLGATPRMYAYPVIALILYSLICDRPQLLAVTVIVSGMLYPIVATIGGLCLACWMLLKPLSALGTVSQWRGSRRLATMILTSFLTLAGLLPMWLDSQPYGRRVIAADIRLYPEAGPDGNYRVYDQLPYKLFGTESIAYFLGPTYSHGDAIVPWINAHKKLSSTTLLSWSRSRASSSSSSFGPASDPCSGRSLRRRSSVESPFFFLVCVVLHVLAWLGAPYLYIPNRVFMYSLPFVITLLFPWSLHRLLNQLPRLRLPSHISRGYLSSDHLRLSHVIRWQRQRRVRGRPLKRNCRNRWPRRSPHCRRMLLSPAGQPRRYGTSNTSLDAMSFLPQRRIKCCI